MINLSLTRSELCLLMAVTFWWSKEMRSELGRSPPEKDTHILLDNCHVCEKLSGKLYDTYCREVEPYEVSDNDSD